MSGVTQPGTAANRASKLLSGIVGTIGAAVGTATCQAAEFAYYPRFRPEQRIAVIEEGALNPAQQLLLQSLQGLVARRGARIYLLAGGAYPVWLRDLKERYGFEPQLVFDLWRLVDEHKAFLPQPGYVLTRLGTDAVNVATSLAGALGALIVDESLEEQAKQHGLHLVLDVRGKTEKWAWENYRDRFNSGLVVQQEERKIHLRDYAIAAGAFTLYDPDDVAFKADVFRAARPDSPLLGWGAGGEDQHVGLGTRFSLFTVPSDWAWNLSLLSGVETGPLRQRRPAGPSASPAAASGVHYVTFVMSDGDNVQWLVGNMATDRRYYADPHRGEFPMGWTISPSLADLAPTVMQWYYDHARNDVFVAGVSGVGYMFPSQYPHLDLHVQRLDAYLKRTDLQIVSLLDTVPIGSPQFRKVAEAYAAQPHVLGGIYLNYADYAAGRGKMVWAHGKPFVAAREKLWSTHPVAMAERINRYPVDPASPAGYTLVNVHPWSHTFDDVATVVAHLASHVRVVDPATFFGRVRGSVER